MTDTDIWLSIRQGFLLIVDAIERAFDIRPRTADLRKEVKCGNKDR